MAGRGLRTKVCRRVQIAIRTTQECRDKIEEISINHDMLFGEVLERVVDLLDEKPKRKTGR